jgi:NAD(P)-dependent dehydrogenase (short-subunit alcohol dehydrogenase family)
VYDEIARITGRDPVMVPLDLEQANDRDFAALAQSIQVEFGRLDGILSNAAALPSLMPLQDESLDRWLSLLRVNLAAPFALTRACMALLKSAPDAAVIMTGDSHGHAPGAYWGGFAVAKAGLETLVRIWAEELGQHPNVRINALIPGPVNSPQRARTHPGETATQRRAIASLMPGYLYWIGPESAGCTGNIVSCAGETA